MKRIHALLCATAPLFLSVVALSGCAQNRDSASSSVSAAQTTDDDLQNTVCPVSGDPVGKSTLAETYQGKIYHFCCDDCLKKFREDPSKYANAVAADPAKYGVSNRN